MKFGPATQSPGGRDLVSLSACGRYELAQPASGKGNWVICENPDKRGTYDFRPLFIERNEAALMTKLKAYEQRRLESLHAAHQRAA